MIICINTSFTGCIIHAQSFSEKSNNNPMLAEISSIILIEYLNADE